MSHGCMQARAHSALVQNSTVATGNLYYQSLVLGGSNWAEYVVCHVSKYLDLRTKKSSTLRRKPPSGCWLCPSADHYASNETFHPRLKPSESHTLDEEVKKKILAQVRAQTNLSSTEKDEAVTKIKDYWRRRENRAP